MVETTICLDDKLMEEAQRLAAETGRSLDALLDNVLRDAVQRSKQAEQETVKPFPTFKLGQPPAGLDMNNNEAVRDFLDAEEPGKY
ncbi:hypothetical protein Pla175_40090 [Pirellulimonas nuda]|uniref:DUF2191 domain-containing protein n=1 Tax=Pirellulimonas nuda TaxID=2528009 RepID=A0A518DGJ5_9BACT|nr:hypothetical protein [Pirellulimonas nuda]QDU90600.1 hypothetical protein Pla175_40090 [Pirellulimonas nuda]